MTGETSKLGLLTQYLTSQHIEDSSLMGVFNMLNVDVTLLYLLGQIDQTNRSNLTAYPARNRANSVMYRCY